MTGIWDHVVSRLNCWRSWATAVGFGQIVEGGQREQFFLQFLPDLQLDFGVVHMLVLLHRLLEPRGDALPECGENRALDLRPGHDAQLYEMRSVELFFIEGQRDKVAEGSKEGKARRREIVDLRTGGEETPGYTALETNRVGSSADLIGVLELGIR